MSTLTNKNQFIIDVPNLGGGRNTKDSNTLINDIEAVDIENFDFEERGAIKKVNGSYKLNTTAITDAPVNSLYEAIKSDGTSHLLAFCGTGIYVSTDGGATFSLLKDGFEANKKWSCYTYADNVIMVNGFDNNQIYDFTAVRDMGLTAPSTAPSVGVGAAGASSIAGNGSSTGGAGGNGSRGDSANNGGGGGAGNPGGTGAGSGAQTGSSGTGGLLVIFVSGLLTIGGSGKLEAKGAAGGNSSPTTWWASAGAGSGGGHIDVFYKTLSGSLAYDVAGGAGGYASGGQGSRQGGAGGAGSTRATQVALPNLFGGGFFNFF